MNDPSLRLLADENLRAMELFSRLLQREGSLFSPGEIEAFARDCGLERREAYLSLLEAACGLEPDRRAEDRWLAEKYFAAALVPRSAALYRQNPYYARIRFPERSLGDWRMTHLAWEPYQLFPCGDTVLYPDGREIAPLGWFEEAFAYPAILEKGREWMTVTPNEIETMAPALSSARGNAAVFGLGLGYFAFMAAEKDCVSAVTVIERDERAIRLFREYVLPQFPNKEKIRLVRADALDYLKGGMESQRFDFAFLDLWHDVSDGLPLYLRLRRLERRFPRTAFHYWIEPSMLIFLRGLFLEDWLAAAGRLDRLLSPALSIEESLSLPQLKRLSLQITPEDIQ